jgi:hypothetical protein
MSSFVLRKLDPEFWVRVQAKAAIEGLTVKALIVKLLTAWLAAVLILLVTACGSSPTAPSAPPPVVVVPPVVPPVVPFVTIQTSPCPTATPGVDLAFYQEIGCNQYDSHQLQPVRRWTLALKIYLKTIDEAGAPIDAVTLDTVQTALIEVAPIWTNGRFPLEGVLRGTDSRDGQTGWVTVKWPATAAAGVCGSSAVAIDGGVINLNYKVAFCGCNGSAMRARTARHELGHALGYWHTDSADDLMSGLAIPTGCDALPSPRERQAAAFHYR